MRWIALTIVPVISLATSGVATAHPGHGLTDPASVTHHVVEPVHAVPWLLLIGVCVTLIGTAVALWRNRQRHAPVVARKASR